jgi:hypothetical protein
MTIIARLVGKMSDQTDNPNDNYDLSSIDQVILTYVVRQLMNSSNATTSDWKSERLEGVE